MSDRWYNVPLGGGLPQDVVEGAADTALFCAVRITYDAAGNEKIQATKAIKAVRDYIACFDTWPPV